MFSCLLINFIALNEAEIYGCSVELMPLIEEATDSFNGDNSIGASVTFSCTQRPLNENGDELVSTCQDTGHWSTPVSINDPSIMTCPLSPEACLTDRQPVVNNGNLLNPTPQGVERLPVGHQLTFNCSIDTGEVTIGWAWAGFEPFLLPGYRAYPGIWLNYPVEQLELHKGVGREF